MVEFLMEGAIIRFSKFLIVWAALLVCSLGWSMVFAQNSQDEMDDTMSRGSIPGDLLRPQRGEAPRYPIDTIIGPLGQGGAPREAYLFAWQAAAALLAGNMNAASLSAMNRVMLEAHISALQAIEPRFYRIGGGREEADGAVSFLVRFAGREQGITGEMYVRLQSPTPAAAARPTPAAETEEQPNAEPAAPAVQAAPARRTWIFEELILDKPRSRQSEDDETKHRFDFSPYERFF